MKRLFLLALLVLATLSATTQLTAAQEATPEIDLATPEAGECTVEPRTGAEIEELTSSTGDATAEVALETPNPDAATPSPFVAPEGSPITDEATVSPITDLVTHYYACQNAGDTLRLFALMTDDFVVRTVESGEIDPAAFADIGTPGSEAISSEQVTISLNGVIEIEADVYGVNVVGIDGATGEEFTDYLIVVREGDGYLVDSLETLSS